MRRKYKNNLLFLATAEFDLVAEVIAHVKFLNQESKICILAPEKLNKSFKELKGVDVVLNAGNNETLSPSEVPAEIIQELKSISFEHIYLASKFNTGNPLYYKAVLQFSASLETKKISLVNYNLRTFPYNRELFENTPRCEICHSGMSFYRYTTYPSASKPAPLYKCDRCNFISQDFSTLDRESLKEEYIDLKVPWLNFHGEMVDKNHREDLSVILRHVPKHSTILDMGCGVGGLEYYARRDGEKVNVISFDLNRGSIDWAKKHGINVHSVDISSQREIIDQLSSLGCEGIDCIYSNNTLEHLARPYEVLKMWMGLLRQEGYMHITIPSVDVVFDDYRGFEKYHLSYFTKDTFTRLIEKVDLIIVDSRVYEENNGAGTSYTKFLTQKY